MGGTDEPSNLFECSVEEHAELHFALYLEHGRWQDWVAYHMLSGMTEEGTTELYKQNAEYMRTRHISEESRQRMSVGQTRRFQREFPEELRERFRVLNGGENNPFYGKNHTEDVKQQIRKKAKEQWQKTKYVWINDGKTEKRVDVNQIPEGFVRGRIKQTK